MEFSIKGLLRKINPLRKRVDKAVSAQGERKDSTTTDQGSVYSGTRYNNRFDSFSQRGYSDTSRAKMAKDAWSDYRRDPRLTSGLSMITSYATMPNSSGLPFTYTLSTGNKRTGSVVKRDIDLALSSPQVDFYNRIDGILKDACIEGSVFYKKIISIEHGRIVKYEKIKGPRSGMLTIGPISSEDENLDGGFLHYDLMLGDVVDFFYSWEVDHYAWNYDEESRYGISLLSPGNENYDLVRSLESYLEPYRKSRSKHTRKFKLKSSTAEQARQEVAIIESSQNQPGRGLEENLYYTEDIKEDNPNVPNDQLNDLKYSAEKSFDSIGVPRGIYGGGGEKVNRATLEFQMNAFISTFISQAEKIISKGFDSFVATQIALLKKSPAIIKCQKTWPSKKVMTEAMIDAFKDAVHEKYISRETYVSRVFGLDYQKEQELIEKENENNEEPEA